MAAPRLEAALHVQVATFLTHALTDPSVFWTTFPAGGGGKARGGKLKGMGLKAGVPDLLVIANGRAHWIELKTPKGRLSMTQQARHADLLNAGCYVATCRSIDEIEGCFRAWHIPLSATVGRRAA